MIQFQKYLIICICHILKKEMLFGFVDRLLFELIFFNWMKVNERHNIVPQLCEMFFFLLFICFYLTLNAHKIDLRLRCIALLEMMMSYNSTTGLSYIFMLRFYFFRFFCFFSSFSNYTDCIFCVFVSVFFFHYQPI